MSTPEDTKAVVLTGGTGYLGSALAQALVNHGYVPIVLSRGEARAPITGASYITADLSSAESLQHAAEVVQGRYTSVAALLHAAAAPLMRKPLLTLSTAQVTDQFAPQTFGAFNFFKAFVPLVKTGGHLIGITTTAIEPGAPYAPRGAYIPAKSALRGMLRTLTSECQDLSVCALAPAFMPGGLNGDMPEAVIELLTKKSAPEDVTTPEEVAKTVLAILAGELQVGGKSVRVPGQTLSDL